MGFGLAADKELARAFTLRAVELGMSSALGGDIRLELAAGTTVLVGKNGAGKSAILERLSEAFTNVWSVARSSQPDPGRLLCDFDIDEWTLRYRCAWFPRDEAIRERVTGLSVARIEEKCSVLASDEEEVVLWSVDDGSLVRNDGTSAEIPPGRTLVNCWMMLRRKQFTFNSMVGPLFNWFSSSSLMRIPVARVRQKVVAPAQLPDKEPLSSLQSLAYDLARRQKEFPDQYEELLEIGRRTKVFDRIHIKRYLDPDNQASAESREDFVSVAIDDIDVGLLSDGTLRAIRIFMSLVDPEIRFLMIDEPESAAHPGLLSRLLAELDAYTDGRQIVLATQSPQVVNWARPDAIRLVERQDGATRVHGLDAETLARVERYLHDDDSLGSFIYGGGIDGLAR
jgi:energy-coupling factor transporter ATP-binding protein EcfA2